MIIAIILIIVISSSMTYQQQTSVPLLKQLLPQQPFLKALSGISFTYAGQVHSIAAIGYDRFIEFFIRKAAHFIIYWLLGYCVMVGCANQMRQRWFAVIVYWLAVTGFAATDEFHQLLTGGRTPLFQDVMLDSVAALIGVLIGAWRLQRYAKKSA